MEIEHLKERIEDYKVSIATVVQKKVLWKTKTKDLIFKTLKNIVSQYDIGWCVQELKWIHSNEAINITFNSFPPELIEKTNLIPSYQFIQGSSIIFSQTYSGDISVFILFPILENTPSEKDNINLGIYNPKILNKKLIIEKVDDFLKEMIKWDVPLIKTKLGF